MDKPHGLRFRISLDFADPKRHDEARGRGSFDLALASLVELHAAGFRVSVARHMEVGENSSEVEARFSRTSSQRVERRRGLT